MTPKEKAESLIYNYVPHMYLIIVGDDIRSAARWAMWDVEAIIEKTREPEEFFYYREVLKELKTFLK